jgi:hypothetical protein
MLTIFRILALTSSIHVRLHTLSMANQQGYRRLGLLLRSVLMLKELRL